MQDNGLGFPLNKAGDYFTQIGEGGWSDVSDQQDPDKFNLGPENVQNPLLKSFTGQIGVNGQGNAARDSAARAARDSAVRDSAARDSAARDSAARDSAATRQR